MNNTRLFPEIEAEEVQTKLVWKGTSTNYTKAQKDFNAALLKHQEASNKVKEIESYLTIASVAYTNEVIPEINKQQKFEKSRLEVLLKIYTKAKVKLGSNQKELLRNLILDECNDRMSSDRNFYFSIVKQLETTEEKNQRIKEKEAAEKELKEKFGIDVDIDDMNKTDFSSDEEREQHKAKYKDFFEKYDSQFNSYFNDYFNFGKNHRERKKTKAQLEKEKKLSEAEKLLSTDINKLFKNLAKLIHPDKEQDEVLREKKAQLMTSLSNARDNMNIAEILSIKMQVDELIPNNETDINFNDSTIKRFVTVLKTKIKQLEETIKEKLYSHPIFNGFQAKTLDIENVNKHIKLVVKESKRQTKDSEDEINFLLQNPNFVVEIIKDYKEEIKLNPFHKF
jgi:hypothetical protein